jgi:hypothetical protein
VVASLETQQGIQIVISTLSRSAPTGFQDLKAVLARFIRRLFLADLAVEKGIEANRMETIQNLKEEGKKIIGCCP